MDRLCKMLLLLLYIFFLFDGILKPLIVCAHMCVWICLPLNMHFRIEIITCKIVSVCILRRPRQRRWRRQRHNRMCKLSRHFGHTSTHHLHSFSLFLQNCIISFNDYVPNRSIACIVQGSNRGWHSKLNKKQLNILLCMYVRVPHFKWNIMAI